MQRFKQSKLSGCSGEGSGSAVRELLLARTARADRVKKTSLHKSHVLGDSLLYSHELLN